MRPAALGALTAAGTAGVGQLPDQLPPPSLHEGGTVPAKPPA